MYKLFLTLRYLRKRRIAYFAIMAVMLCVAMVLIVMSVMGGFLDKIKAQARGLLGDMIVDNQLAHGFPLYDEFIAEIQAWPEIEKATPVIYTAGLLRLPEPLVTAMVNVVGIRLEEVYRINAFKDGLFYERHYPGSTTLAAQRKPVIGLDVDGPRIIDTSPETGEKREIPRPLLPPELQTALETSWKNGVYDKESPEGDWLSGLLKANHLPPIAGIYEGMYGGLNYGPPGWADEPRPGIILGRDLIAERLADGKYYRSPAYPRGYMLTVAVIPVGIRGSLDSPITQPFRYADDSRTGIYEIDSKSVYCEFALLQRLVKWEAAEREDGTTAPARCSQIQIKLKNLTNDATRQALARRMTETYRSFIDSPRFVLDENDRRLLDRVQAKTWEESQLHIIAPVEKERIMMTILFGIISLVAVVLILCILYMIALQKTRDIGIVKSIGGSSGGVASIFLMYGVAVGLVGGVLGAALGYLFVTNINEIQEFLIRINPEWRVWDRSVYSFDEIPSTVRTLDLVVVVAVAIVASTIGSVAAAVRSGFMQPVKALSYE